MVLIRKKSVVNRFSYTFSTYFNLPWHLLLPIQSGWRMTRWKTIQKSKLSPETKRARRNTNSNQPFRLKIENRCSNISTSKSLRAWVSTTVEFRFMGSWFKGIPAYGKATPKSHLSSLYFVIFIIPPIRDPLIRETPYMGWDFLVLTAILYPNQGIYSEVTKKLIILVPNHDC